MNKPADTARRVDLRKLTKLASEAEELIDMERIYLNDGAPRTAAQRYRDAADVLVRWADLRDRMMDAPPPQGVKAVLSRCNGPYWPANPTGGYRDSHRL